MDCGPLPELKFGSIHLSEERTSYSVVATYSCHENYTLIGNENRTCLQDGWSGKQPECLVDWCPDPQSITGGNVHFTDKRAGSTATYVCEPGYVLVGEAVNYKRIYNRGVCYNYRPIFRLFPADWAENGLAKHRLADLWIAVHLLAPIAVYLYSSMAQQL